MIRRLLVRWLLPEIRIQLAQIRAAHVQQRDPRLIKKDPWAP